MSTFKFGVLRVDVERDGEEHGRDVYLIRIRAPKGEPYSESKISLKKQPRSTGTDFELAAYMLEELKEASRDPQGWLAKAQAESSMSPEEILETLLFAEDMEDYLPEATAAAHERAPIYYGEHRGLVLGISRPLELPSRIKTKEDMANFFAYLELVEHVAYHPDDKFQGYVDRNWKKTYTRSEATVRNWLMKHAFNVSHKEGLDIYEVSLWVSALVGNGDPENKKSAPAWLKELSKSWGTKAQ